MLKINKSILFRLQCKQMSVEVLAHGKPRGSAHRKRLNGDVRTGDKGTSMKFGDLS